MCTEGAVTIAQDAQADSRAGVCFQRSQGVPHSHYKEAVLAPEVETLPL